MKKFTNRLYYAFKTFVLRQSLPYLFGMVITDRCNLNCFYCDSKNSGQYHFSFSHALGTMEDAYRRGHRSLYFSGGEPMIWKDDGMDLQALVKLARQIGFFDVFVFTNGTIPLSIRDCNYIVTIDGPREIHDKIRPNTYDVIIDNVRNAVTKSVFASITFCKINGDYVTQFVKETTDLNVFKGISFNLLTHRSEIVARQGILGNARINLLDSLWKLKHEGYPILLSKAAYIAMRNNNWKRPIPQIELATNTKIYKCCRDVDKPIVCEQCGYVNCVEVSQILAFKPSAMAQVLKML